MRKAKIDLGKVGLWTGVLDSMPSSAANELCAEASELGFKTIWIPEAVGRDPFVGAMRILENTSDLVIATGIANIYEVSTHLRGEAGKRQVEGARLGLTHVIGLGSACAIHILEKPES